jgi:hypothetical protein
LSGLSGNYSLDDLVGVQPMSATDPNNIIHFVDAKTRPKGKLIINHIIPKKYESVPLKYPDFEPDKERIGCKPVTPFYSHADIPQDNGLIAHFQCRNGSDIGWKFISYITIDEFCIIDSDKLNDENYNWYYGEMVESKTDASKFVEDLEYDIEVNLSEGDEVFAYEFGGILSMRGGLFVAHKDNPSIPLRYKQLIMS